MQQRIREDFLNPIPLSKSFCKTPQPRAEIRPASAQILPRLNPRSRYTWLSRRSPSYLLLNNPAVNRLQPASARVGVRPDLSFDACKHVIKSHAVFFQHNTVSPFFQTYFSCAAWCSTFAPKLYQPQAKANTVAGGASALVGCSLAHPSPAASVLFFPFPADAIPFLHPQEKGPPPPPPPPTPPPSPPPPPPPLSWLPFLPCRSGINVDTVRLFAPIHFRHSRTFPGHRI